MYGHHLTVYLIIIQILLMLSINSTSYSVVGIDDLGCVSNVDNVNVNIYQILLQVL